MRADVDIFTGQWHSLHHFDRFQFQCGYCGNQVSSAHGYIVTSAAKTSDGGRNAGYPALILCPSCNLPNLFIGRFWSQQTPVPTAGRILSGLPHEIEKLYDEARSCTGAGAYTACILICRKLLMHVAVEQGAKAGGSFISYVEYLAVNGWIPPTARSWVDHIRLKSNEANHDIILMTRADAEELLLFVEALLSHVYEMPSRMKLKQTATAQP